VRLAGEADRFPPEEILRKKIGEMKTAVEKP
jgi:hypothetical protein